jgi:hypothetical protein
MKEQYLNIHYRILKNRNFTSDEKLILAEIVALSQLKNGCTAGDEHYVDIINKSRQTVNGIMKKFERAGLIILDVKKGKGKKTKLAANFEELLKFPVKNQTILEVVQIPLLVEISDNTCRESSDLGVENEDTTCRETDTIITPTITGLLLQEELQYTGATGDSSIENIDNRYQDACSRLIELLRTDPALLTNSFLLEFQNCLFELENKFGIEFNDNCHIFKSNNELYEIYGSSNFYEVREDLIFVKENMDRFLRQKTFI